LHKKEVAILRNEKDVLGGVLEMKTNDIQKTLTNEIDRLEDEMKKHYRH